MQFFDGGVCFPKGFTAHGVLAGIKKGRTKEDVALIVSEKQCNASGVFTKNLVQAEPVKLSKKHLESRRSYAVIANSGNANACTGKQGEENALRMASCTAEALKKSGLSGITAQDVLVCSTGVIGQQIAVEKIEAKIGELVSGLSKEGNVKARQAIMTTDTCYKEGAVQTLIGGKEVRLGTMAKGSGMIHINMGTMLGFITTDCAITSDMLDEALKESADATYNCVSVDGDSSTNDTLLILANGMAENPVISKKDDNYYLFLDALNALNTQMARAIAGDGEGATHLIECTVIGAKDVATARVLAKSVISSSLVKAAFFGRDANWGRILCALGYSGEFFTPAKTSVSFTSEAGSIVVFDHGTPVNFDEVRAKEILGAKEVKITVVMEDGEASGTAWGCDLTYDYVKINGDYRT
jgi:glutamate N-acetyltransferase/amino-acid N-acetyltransferase